MDPRFNQITRQDIERACLDIINGVHRQFSNATRWSVVYRGYDLPPKAVIQRAYHHATGQHLPVQGEAGFSGGVQSNSFLKNQGFEIADRPSDKTLKEKAVRAPS